MDNFKILLVYPRYPDSFWSFKNAMRFISKKATVPPPGLITVASMLPEKWEKSDLAVKLHDYFSDRFLYKNIE